MPKQEIRFYRFHRHGKPLPEGWEPTPALDGTHHGHHAKLLREIDDGTARPKKGQPPKQKKRKAQGG